MHVFAGRRIFRKEKSLVKVKVWRKGNGAGKRWQHNNSLKWETSIEEKEEMCLRTWSYFLI